LQINNKNILGWLSLALQVYDVDNDVKEKIVRYLKRRDIARRQKEIDEYWR
jgi:hypothetical protein